MLEKFRRRKEPPRVVVSDRGVERTLADGRVESVTWDALEEVLVMTTSDGPFAEDVFFVLGAGEQGCVVPQSLVPDELLERLQALPGFDDLQMIEAMSSATEAQFVLWRRDAAT